MGLLGALKLPQPPGSTGAPNTSPNTSPDPSTQPAGKGGVGGSMGKAVDAIRKAAEAAKNGNPKDPKASPPPKKGGIAGVIEAALAAQVLSADNQMNAALAAANNVGNPLNNRTQGQPESAARKYWQAGMTKYWQPGSAGRLQALSLQGAARIAKAQEAAALLGKARVVFQEGLGLLG